MPDSSENDTTPPLPAAPCFIGTVEERLERIEQTVGEIRTALCGNQRLGHRGLVCRVKDVEAIVAKHDRKLIAWGAAITTALALFSTLKDWLHK